jgi:hypothetical protein
MSVYLPTGQSTGVVLPVVENFPAGASLHEFCPVVSWYVPAVHNVHVCVLPAEKDPLAQSEHVKSPAGIYLPWLHAVHVAAPLPEN